MSDITTQEALLLDAVKRLGVAIANRKVSDSERLGGKSLGEVEALVLGNTVANSTRLEGRTLDDIVTMFENGEVEGSDYLLKLLTDFIARTDNPHDVTKAQVGLSEVQNLNFVDKLELEADLADKILQTTRERYIGPSSLKLMVERIFNELVEGSPEALNTLNEFATALGNDPTFFESIQAEIDSKLTPAEGRALIEDFLARSDNPFQVTKGQIGLGLVENLPIATDAEAVDPTPANAYVTPHSLQLRVNTKQYGKINVLEAVLVDVTDAINLVTGNMGGVREIKLYVMVGLDGVLATSPDGITWTKRASPISQRYHEVTYGNGEFVAVGEGDWVVKSTDGVTWTKHTRPFSGSIIGIGNGFVL